jgi:hypothetical protein
LDSIVEEAVSQAAEDAENEGSSATSSPRHAGADVGTTDDDAPIASFEHVEVSRFSAAAAPVRTP